eukprot:874285-Ditylum_brightwellii.AAC.1
MQKEGKIPEGDVLHQLWAFQRKLQTLPKDLVWQMLQDDLRIKFPCAMPANNKGMIIKQLADGDKCMVGRDGDWTCTPFQCDCC